MRNYLNKKGEAKCIVCFSINVNELFKTREFIYLKCTKCDLVFLKKMPSRSYYKRLYSYEDSLSEEISKLNPILYIYSKIPLLAGLRIYWSDYVNKMRAKSIVVNKEKGKILDVGCGSGNFLKKMEMYGWKVWGIEVGEKLVKIARTKLTGAKVYKGLLEETKLGKERFDVVTLWHVFEHMADPKAVIKKTSAILKKKGLLVIEVPHSKALNLSIFRRYWTLLLEPQHLHFWSRDSLKVLLKEFDLNLEKVDYPIHFPFVFLSSLVKWNRKTIIFIPIILPVSFLLTVFSSFIGKGDVIRIYATKQ